MNLWFRDSYTIIEIINCHNRMDRKEPYMGDRDKMRRNMDQMPLKDFPLAMAYVPWQEWERTCDVEEGFQRGTIFPSLYKPFTCYKFAK